MDLFYKLLYLKHYYSSIKKLYKKIKIICFLNLSFKLDVAILLVYHLYLYFFLTFQFFQKPCFIVLKKKIRKFSLRKLYPLGIKLSLNNKSLFKFFLDLFNLWFYYNIFGNLKKGFFDKKRGVFYGIKFPFFNLFYMFDYNILTYLLYNWEISTIKFFFFVTNSTKKENLILKINCKFL